MRRKGIGSKIEGAKRRTEERKNGRKEEWKNGRTEERQRGRKIGRSVEMKKDEKRGKKTLSE
jgi:hypothetical protein